MAVDDLAHTGETTCTDRDQTQLPSQSQLRTPRHAHRLQEEDDGDEALTQLGACRDAYLALEDCLVETDRAWNKCQKQVKALRGCQEKAVSNSNA